MDDTDDITRRGDIRCEDAKSRRRTGDGERAGKKAYQRINKSRLRCNCNLQKDKKI